MNNSNLDQWPEGINGSSFPTYKLRAMVPLGLWEDDGWAIKAYGIQIHKRAAGDPMFAPELERAAREHVLGLLPLTREEGAFYKTGFAVLHEGAQANWLLFQWWAHDDVWCQFLSYSSATDPFNFKFSSRPIVACVYETAIIWHEQKAWIENVLSGRVDRRAYLENMSTARTC